MRRPKAQNSDVYLDRQLRLYKDLTSIIETLKVKAVKGNTRDIYALNTLISQQRELINDIRASKESKDMKLGIEQNVLRFLVDSMGRSVTECFFSTKSVIKQQLSTKETHRELEKAFIELSRNIQLSYDKSVVLLEETLSPTKTKRKRK